MRYQDPGRRPRQAGGSHCHDNHAAIPEKDEDSTLSRIPLSVRTRAYWESRRPHP